MGRQCKCIAHRNTIRLIQQSSIQQQNNIIVLSFSVMYRCITQSESTYNTIHSHFQKYSSNRGHSYSTPGNVTVNIFQKCMDCEAAFNSDVTIHHCRRCGEGFCDDCSSHRCPVPERGWGLEPVRVCNQCSARSPQETISTGEELLLVKRKPIGTLPLS